MVCPNLGLFGPEERWRLGRCDANGSGRPGMLASNPPSRLARKSHCNMYTAVCQQTRRALGRRRRGKMITRLQEFSF